MSRNKFASPSEMMELTKADVEELRSLYHANVKKNNDVFTFKNREIVVSYAKYLLEYIDSLNTPKQSK